MLTSEGIDELAKFAGKMEEVKTITRKAMGGTMSFRESLTKRLNIIQPTKSMVRLNKTFDEIVQFLTFRR